MKQPIENEINLAYEKLAKARRLMRAINQTDTNGLLSSSVQGMHERFLNHQAEEAEALLEIERLKLIIEARYFDPKVYPVDPGGKYILRIPVMSDSNRERLKASIRDWLKSDDPIVIVSDDIELVKVSSVDVEEP